MTRFAGAGETSVFCAREKTRAHRFLYGGFRYLAMELNRVDPANRRRARTTFRAA
jgi:hypothetical protein